MNIVKEIENLIYSLKRLDSIKEFTEDCVKRTISYGGRPDPYIRKNMYRIANAAAHSASHAASYYAVPETLLAARNKGIIYYTHRCPVSVAASGAESQIQLTHLKELLSKESQ